MKALMVCPSALHTAGPSGRKKERSKIFINYYSGNIRELERSSLLSAQKGWSSFSTL